MDDTREQPVDKQPEAAVGEPLLATLVREQPPSKWRELLAVLLLVVLCDLTIYRGQGFAGYALLFLAAPLLLTFGSPRPRLGRDYCLVGLMTLVLAGKMIWCGSMLLVAAGFALLVALAMALSGLCPYVLEMAVFLSQTVLAGYEGLIHHWRCLGKLGPPVSRTGWLNVVLPLAAFVAFGLLFIMANPDLLTSFGETVELFFNTLRNWILAWSPNLSEALFWAAVVWITVGLLRPVVRQTLFREASDDPSTATGPATTGPTATGPTTVEPTSATSETALYSAFRNTLLTVIGLFAVYLVFEFKTLWGQVFPDGFYYSGYAHEGAAWLTVALALATAVLSLVFRGQILDDPRLPRLRKLAWIWSLENGLLALAVYHRLSIYIGFNGMTRMRMVGIFGMSAVVVGFVLVVWKITHGRSFVWLVRRHLWTLALAVYLFALTPVDTIVHSYNVRRIMSGDPAPVVQISVHPISSEGVLLLQPLLECDNETIREGIRAMLAQRLAKAESVAVQRSRQGWTTYQAADNLVLDRLRAAKSRFAKYADPASRNPVLSHFHEYAYQWY